MDGLYWLIALLIIVALGGYGRYWYHRPSEMSEILTASLSYQMLEYMDFSARRNSEHPDEEYEVRKDKLTVYTRGRQLSWRQRNDIIRYLRKMDWAYEVPNEQGVKHYVMSRAGKRELETASSLGAAVKETAQTLHDEGISGDQAKATAAAVVAAYLRVHARSSENRKHEQASADEIEKAARTQDSDKIDHAIDRTRNILQIVTMTVPYMRDVLRIFGWL